MEGDDPRVPLYCRVAEICQRPGTVCFRGADGEITERQLVDFGYDCWLLKDGTASFSEYQMSSVGSLRRAGDGRYVATAVPPPINADAWRTEEGTQTREFESPAEALDWFLSIASPSAWIPVDQRPWWWKNKLAKIDVDLIASFEA